MLNAYRKNGADAYEAHQLLEMLLFNTIRRSDTNPTAHRVLDNFPTVSLLSATSEELTEVQGIGEKSAELIRLSEDFTLRMLLDTIASAGFSGDFQIRLYLYLLFRRMEASCVLALFLSKKGKLLEYRILSKNRQLRETTYSKKILEIAKATNASGVVLSHNHISNIKSASLDDVYLTEHIKSVLEKEGISFLGHYVVTDTDCVPCEISED